MEKWNRKNEDHSDVNEFLRMGREEFHKYTEKGKGRKSQIHGFYHPINLIKNNDRRSSHFR